MASSVWLVPAVYVLAALVLGAVLPQWDRRAQVRVPLPLSADSARDTLSVIASGMLTFTGFVFSIGLLVIQFGSTAFSPRLARWLRRDGIVKHALGVFTATFLFALTALAVVERSPAGLPTRTFVVALLLLLASLSLYLALLGRVMDRLRVATVTQDLARQAWRVLDRVYPDPVAAGPAAAAERVAPTLGHPVQAVAYVGPPAVVVALDEHGLSELAHRADVVVQFVPALGDAVASDDVLLRVYGPRAVPERRLRSTVVLGDERTLDGDPAFALRLLVDIALKALSPAVNDPTTAVQVMDALHYLLKRVAHRRLDVGLVHDRDGTLRLVFPTPSWNDLLCLALEEIRGYGQGSVQVVRRLRALLEDLLDDVPESRRSAIGVQLQRLDAAVARNFPDPADQRVASVADRQGLGPARLR